MTEQDKIIQGLRREIADLRAEMLLESSKARDAKAALEGLMNSREKTVNDSPLDTEFICRECGLAVSDWFAIKIDRLGEEVEYSFKFNYCPKCGRKIV